MTQNKNVERFNMDSKLGKYNQKRNFQKTPEPKGKEGKENKKAHFVIQHHFARKEHYDFRLEWSGVLLSWAVPKEPTLNPSEKRLAVHVEDHPLEYRKFEGEIPQGQYGGGIVKIWDKGYYEALNDFEKGLKEGSLKFILYGKKLKGMWYLVKMKQEDNRKDNWLLIKG